MTAEWTSVSNSLPDRQQLVLAFYVNSFGKPRIVRAEYATLHTLMLHEDSSGGCACGTCDGEYAAVGWYESNEREEVHWIITEPVTHWMPLPPPPVASTEGVNA